MPSIRRSFKPHATESELEIAENLINEASMDEMDARAEIEKISTDDDLIRQIAQASMEMGEME